MAHVNSPTGELAAGMRLCLSSSVGEQRFYTPRVRGSIPWRGTNSGGIGQPFGCKSLLSSLSPSPIRLMVGRQIFTLVEPDRNRHGVRGGNTVGQDLARTGHKAFLAQR